MDPPSKELWVGVDWGDEEHEVCVVDAQSEVVDAFPLSPIAAPWLRPSAATKQQNGTSRSPSAKVKKASTASGSGHGQKARSGPEGPPLSPLPSASSAVP